MDLGDKFWASGMEDLEHPHVTIWSCFHKKNEMEIDEQADDPKNPPIQKLNQLM